MNDASLADAGGADVDASMDVRLGDGDVLRDTGDVSDPSDASSPVDMRPACEEQRHGRNLYVWDNAVNVIEPGPGRQTLLRFLETPRGDESAWMSGIYLEVRKSTQPGGGQHPEKPGAPTQAHYDDELDYLGPEAATMREFLREAHQAGVERVEFLDGNPYWLFDRYRDDLRQDAEYVPVELCREVVRFNQDADCSAGECFDGIHLDIEPHVVRPDQPLWFGEGWWDGADVTTADITEGSRDPYNNRMSQALIDVARHCREAIGDEPITLSLALGHDYVYYHRDLRPLFLGLAGDHAYNLDGVDYQGVLDYVTVMNYRDYDSSSPTNEFIDGWSEGEHEVGGIWNNLEGKIREDPDAQVAHEMPMRFAVETIGGVPERVTFGGGSDAEGFSCLEATLDAADVIEHPGLLGLDVHHYGYPEDFDGATVVGGYADPENLPAGDCAVCASTGVGDL